MIFENELKKESIETISILKNCEIRSIMATGDNTLTAVAVARQCKIIDSNKILIYSDVENQEIRWKCESYGVENIDLNFIKNQI